MSLLDKQQETAAFPQYAASKKLYQLAQHPFDLTAEGNLTAERLQRLCVRGCGYRLLYGTERVTEEVIDVLCELAEQACAVERMEQMQAGAVMNRIAGYRSENRTVLHTASRGFFLSTLMLPLLLKKR